MVKRSASLDATFAALSDPTRRAILARLRRGSASVMEVAEPFPCSLPAISKHLRVLERAGFIRRTKAGRVHRLELTAQPLQEAADWIETYRSFWEERLDSLAEYLGSLKQKEKRK